MRQNQVGWPTHSLRIEHLKSSLLLFIHWSEKTLDRGILPIIHRRKVQSSCSSSIRFSKENDELQKRNYSRSVKDLPTVLHPQVLVYQRPPLPILHYFIPHSLLCLFKPPAVLDHVPQWSTPNIVPPCLVHFLHHPLLGRESIRSSDLWLFEQGWRREQTLNRRRANVQGHSTMSMVYGRRGEDVHLTSRGS
jgi:hypothetical protein